MVPCFIYIDHTGHYGQIQNECLKEVAAGEPQESGARDFLQKTKCTLILD
jgi:hypothetical protein